MNLYFRYVMMHLRAQMQYRVSFFLTVLGQFLLSFSAFIVIYFLFQRFHTVEGYTFEQVLLCFAICNLSFRFAELAARGFDTFGTVLGNGEFDRMMVRPRGLMFQVLAGKMEFSKIGQLLQGLVVFCYAVPTCGIAWGMREIVVLLLMMAGQTFLFFSLFVLYAGLCFFTTEGLEFLNIFTDGGREFLAYPLAIYGKEVVTFVTFVIPFALVQYYPLCYLLGQTDQLWYGLLPLLGAWFFIPCYLIWKSGVRHYRSTGS